jgi:hypothetical protein
VHNEFDLERKLAFFTETRQAFGRSALLLSGGASFGTNSTPSVKSHQPFPFVLKILMMLNTGMYHLGVVRALHEQQLLPRIVSGSSVGSIIAAIVGTTEKETEGIKQKI